MKTIFVAFVLFGAAVFPATAKEWDVHLACTTFGFDTGRDYFLWRHNAEVSHNNAPLAPEGRFTETDSEFLIYMPSSLTPLVIETRINKQTGEFVRGLMKGQMRELQSKGVCSVDRDKQAVN